MTNKPSAARPKSPPLCGCVWKNVPFDDGFYDKRTCDLHNPDWRSRADEQHVSARADGVSDDY